MYVINCLNYKNIKYYVVLISNQSNPLVYTMVNNNIVLVCTSRGSFTNWRHVYELFSIMGT